MKYIMTLKIQCGIGPRFVEFKIFGGKKLISYGILYHDGTAYVSCWNGKYFMVENVDSSVIFDFIDGKKSLSEVDFYLKSAYLEMQDIIEAENEYPDEAPRYDLRDEYLIHNFCAYTMEEVDKKKKENQKKLKKLIFNVI